MAQETCLQVTMGLAHSTRRSKIHSTLTTVVAALLLTSECQSLADGAPVQNQGQEDAASRSSPFQFLSQNILVGRLPGVRVPETLKPPKPPIDEQPFERPTGFLGVATEEVADVLSQPRPFSETFTGPRVTPEDSAGPRPHHTLHAQQLGVDVENYDADDWDWDDWQEDDQQQQEEEQREEEPNGDLFGGDGVVPEWQLQGQAAEESALTNVRGAGRRRVDTAPASTNAQQQQQNQRQQGQQQYPDEEEDEWDADSDQPVQGGQQQRQQQEPQDQQQPRWNSGQQRQHGDEVSQAAQQGNLRSPTGPSSPASRRDAGAATAAPQQQRQDDDDWWDEEEDAPLQGHGEPQQQQQQQPQQQRQQQPQGQRLQQRQQQQPQGQQADDADASVRRRRRQFLNAALAAAQAAASAFFDNAGTASEADDGQGVDLHQINKQVENIVNDFLNARNPDSSSNTAVRAASTETVASSPFDDEEQQKLMQKYLQQQQDRAQQQLQQQQELRSLLLQQQAEQLKQLQEEATSGSRPGDTFDYRRNALEGFEARRRGNFN